MCTRACCKELIQLQKTKSVPVGCFEQQCAFCHQSAQQERVLYGLRLLVLSAGERLTNIGVDTRIFSFSATFAPANNPNLLSKGGGEERTTRVSLARIRQLWRICTDHPIFDLRLPVPVQGIGPTVGAGHQFHVPLLQHLCIQW
jgi:hypothetical protein